MKFTKTKTCVSMDGQFYEVRVAALLFLRCKTSATISQFQLATNAAVGGQKLDDVILRYKTIDEPDIWHTCFLQLKKKAKKTLTDAALTGNSSDFALKNYLKSFLTIKKAMSVDDKEELLNGLFEDCQFILYTNANVDGLLRDRTERGSLGEIETLLRSESECATVLGFEEERDGVIFAAIETDNGKEFIRKMKVFSGQPTPVQLEDLIKKEMRLGDSVLDKYSDMLYDYYEKGVMEWWENSDELLDEKSDLYDRALDKVRTFHANVVSSREKSQACLDVRFKDLKSFEDNFDSESRFVALLHVIAPETSQKLSCTKLLQFMQPNCYTFFQLECLQQELDRVLPVWKLKENPPWLVILSKSTDDCRELGDKICEILQENPEKRIAIVSQEFDKFTSYIKRNLDNNYTQLKDDSKAAQLEEEAIVKLTEMNLSFQGCSVDLKSVFNQNDTLLEDIVLDDSLVDSFISNKTHVVGSALLGDTNFYIPRTLLSETVLQNDVFSAGLKGTVAVSGVLPQEIQQTQETNTSGVRTRLTSDGYHVEELSEEVGSTRWIHECGERYNIDNCLELNERSVLLVGEPGMGKTIFIYHLARQTKKAHPHFWVICINLIEHTNLLKEASLFESHVEFLSLALGLSGSPFEMSLLRLSVERAGNVVVILDGFDEISPEYETEGFRLIAGLLKTKVKKLWVTTRYFIKERVEREMSVSAMKLQEFSTEDQVDFLTKFWKEKHGCSCLPDVELKELTDKLLAKVSESLNDKERLFTGNPLQTMMLAEVFSDYAANLTENPIPSKLNLLYLFEEFVEKKFMIYIRKMFPYTYMELNRLILKEMKTNFHQKHMNASLVYLLPPKWLEKLHSKDEIIRRAEQFVKDVESGEDKTGIVDSVAHNRPNFIHRCFAEFYAAKLFYISYKQNQEFLRDHIFNKYFEVVYQIFNNLLTRQLPLHAAVLCNDVEKAKQLLQHTDINCIDHGGRSPLHLAAGYNFGAKILSFPGLGYGSSNFFVNNESVDRKQLHMINLLLDNGADVNMIDSVLQRTPFQYAIHAENWDAAEILLTKNANPKEFFFPANKHNPTLWSSIINDGHTSLMKCIVDQGLFAGDHSDNHYVVQSVIVNGHLGLVKLLVSNSEDVLLPRLEGRTLIHQAVRRRRTEILNFLIGILKRDIGEVGCAEGINRQDDAGFTAMFLACENGFLDIVRLLSKSGGDLKLLNKDRQHLLLNASYRGFFDVVKFVIDSMDNDSMVIKACLNAVDGMGMTSVICASLYGHSDILSYLVEKGADITLGYGPAGSTALHIAIGNTRLSDVKLMIESLGENRDSIARFINAPLAQGATYMHCVTELFTFPISSLKKKCLADQVEIAKYLVSKGGDVRSIDRDGNTALHCAAQNYPHIPTMKVFVESLGNDRDARVSYINTRNLYGRTAKDCVLDNDFYLPLLNTEEFLEVVNWFDKVLETNSNVGS